MKTYFLLIGILSITVIVTEVTSIDRGKHLGYIDGCRKSRIEITKALETIGIRMTTSEDQDTICERYYRGSK